MSLSASMDREEVRKVASGMGIAATDGMVDRSNVEVVAEACLGCQ